jgi:hypothetical protein
MNLEELLVQEGVAAPKEQIRQVLDRARGDGRHAIEALVEDGIVAEDVLADLLARAAGTVVVDLDRGTLDEEAPHVISGSAARLHLMLPVSAPTAGKVRVAFVNPLDEEAIAAVEAATSSLVHALVGTLGGIRQAIEKAYANRTTRVVRQPGSEMPQEITRKVAGALPSKDTSPVHRIEQEATIEQRHEALLLALIERGVLTRADYAEALKRLLSGRRDE